MPVYFIQVEGGGPIKIGASAYPERRCKSLFPWSPYPLEIVATLPGGLATEKAIHKRFATSRLRHEWYHPTPELLHFIASALAGHELDLPSEIDREVSPRFKRSDLNALLAESGVSFRQLAGALHMTPECVRTWCRDGIPRSRINEVLRTLTSLQAEAA